ncbi:unnamed protein product [Cylindrotheca closterium]|uniref:Uncharacterized protein n=1 Tax=Cylindrotheca closterium TaxID=2856 RepID=A0AAD2FMK9_9STRA|nr:unnamed protein product [Cylindrotheca closterium]
MSFKAARRISLLLQLFLLVSVDAFFASPRTYAVSNHVNNNVDELLLLPTTHHPSIQQQHSIRSPQADHLNSSSPPSSFSTTRLNMIWKPIDPKGMAMDFPKTKTRFVATILATLLTWHGIVAHQMNPVLASAVSTLVITMWSPGLGQAAFCGSFAGMTSGGTLISTSLIALLNAILFEVVVHRENKWLGLGGRLGMIAFVASNIVADVLLSKPHAMLQVPMSLPQWWSILQKSPWKYSMVCAAIGSVATIVLREVAENASNIDNDLRDPIRAAAVIGLIASLSQGMGFGDYYKLDNFGSLLVFGGAFTGMSLPSRLLTGVVPVAGDNNDDYNSSTTEGQQQQQQQRKPPGAYSIVLWYAVAGALGGLVHALTIPLNWWTGGIWGGKAGTCAFAGVCLFRGLEKMVYTLRQSLGWIKS